MTSFVDDNGNYLDYSGEDFGITKQAATWHDFKLKGDFSVDFKIPNTAKNREALGYYGAQQIDSPAFGRQPFNVIRNGNRIMRGSLFIKGSDANVIDCFFVSGNTNWFNALQFSLREIEWPDRYTVSAVDPMARKTATEGIIFPIVDWWAMGEHRSWDFAVYRSNISETEGPTNNEAHPCLYLHTILNEMCKWGGVKVVGDLINDPLFRKIIITPDGPDTFWPDAQVEASKINLSADSTTYLAAGGAQKVSLTKTSGNGIFDGDYIVRQTCVLRCEMSFTFSVSQGYSIKAYLDGAFDSTVFDFTTAATSKNAVFYIDAVKGQRLSFYIQEYTGAGTDFNISGSTISIQIAPLIGTYYRDGGYFGNFVPSYVSPSAIVPDIKAVDFIKFLCIYFGAVCSYDEYSKTLTINKLSRMQKEDGEDWSEYFVSAKVNYQTGVATHNYIQMESGDEVQVVEYNSRNPVTYGGGDLQTEFDVTYERDLYKAPVAIAYGPDILTLNTWPLPYVKFYEMEFVEETEYTSVSASGAYSQFTSTFQSDLTPDFACYIQPTGADSSRKDYKGWALIRASSTTSTNPRFRIDFIATDSGRIKKCKFNKIKGPHRLLIVQQGYTVADAGGPSSMDFENLSSTTSSSTAAVAWGDKPLINDTIDLIKDSLAIDSPRSENISIGERYHRELENILGNPKVEAVMLLPTAVFERFNFQNYVYLKTKDVTGYFWVQKIENYKDADTPVKVELLYVD